MTDWSSVGRSYLQYFCYLCKLYIIAYELILLECASHFNTKAHKLKMIQCKHHNLLDTFHRITQIPRFTTTIAATLKVAR